MSNHVTLLSSCETPLHTIDILRAEIAQQPNDRKTGAAFLRVDTRVLTWLLDDAETLNRLIAAQIEAAP